MLFSLILFGLCGLFAGFLLVHIALMIDRTVADKKAKKEEKVPIYNDSDEIDEDLLKEDKMLNDPRIIRARQVLKFKQDMKKMSKKLITNLYK